MLCTPFYFPIFSALTAAVTSFRKKGDALHLVSVDSQVLLGPHRSHSYKVLSTTLSTS